MKTVFYAACIVVGFVAAMVLDTILSMLPRKEP